MDLLKEIGAILGFVAFGGLAILAFLTFQQARHLRRLREWAGREPERAVAEADRVSEAAGEAATEVRRGEKREEERTPSRFDRIRGWVTVRMEEFNRRSPVSPKILLGGLLAVIIGVGIATSGFGLLGGGDGASESTADDGEAAKVEKVEVAVLNGTAPEEGAAAVDGAADRASELIKETETYKAGEVATAPGSFPASVIMFTDGNKSEGSELAAELEEALGPIELELMTPEVEDLAAGAEVALIVGVDDSAI